MTRLHCWPVPTLNQIRHFIFLVQVLHRTPICVLTWVYESCTKFLVTGLSCPKLFGNLLNALWGKKRLLLNASKHSPECFLLCLNRLSVTKKNMLLVPKYFVTVPDDDPEILINLSHPWTSPTYTCRNSVQIGLKLNHTDFKMNVFETYDRTATCRAAKAMMLKRILKKLRSSLFYWYIQGLKITQPSKANTSNIRDSKTRNLLLECTV